MRWLLDMITEYAKRGGKATREGVTGTKSTFVSVRCPSFRMDPQSYAPQDPKLKRAIDELRTLLERFANNTSLDLVIDAIDALIDDANRDEHLRSWFKDVDTYARKVWYKHFERDLYLFDRLGFIGTGIRLGRAMQHRREENTRLWTGVLRRKV